MTDTGPLGVHTPRPFQPASGLFDVALEALGVEAHREGDRSTTHSPSTGHVAITAEMAVRIAAVLGTTAQYWLNLQNAVDLYDADERLATSENRPKNGGIARLPGPSGIGRRAPFYRHRRLDQALPRRVQHRVGGCVDGPRKRKEC